MLAPLCIPHCQKRLARLWCRPMSVSESHLAQEVFAGESVPLSLSLSWCADMRKIGSSRGAVTAYPRQLESLIRLSEAHAKMRRVC